MRKALTIKEVAELLGVSRHTVAAKARTGEIPSVKLGRRRLFRPEVIEEWTRSQGRPAAIDEDQLAERIADLVVAKLAQRLTGPAAAASDRKRGAA